MLKNNQEKSSLRGERATKQSIDIKKKNIFFLLWPYIWSNQGALQKFKFILFMLVTIITTLVIVSVPVVLKYAVSALKTKKEIFGILPIVIVVGYGVLWALTKVVDRIRHQAAFPMLANMIHKFCLDLFTHLQKLSMSFHSRRKSGKIFNTISRARMAMARFVQSLAQELIPIFLQIILASVLLTYYCGVRYGIVLLALLGFYIILSAKTSGSITKCRQSQNKKDGAANACIVDSILNAQTVKYFDMEDYEARQAELLLREKEDADVKSLMSDAKIHLIQNGIIGAAVLLLTIMSGFGVFSGSIQVGDFVMINGFVLMLMRPLITLGYRYRVAKLNLAHLESAFELLQEPIEIKDEENAKPLMFKKGKIEFKDVIFGYSKKRLILNHLSFIVSPGKTTAIVGASGAGKSTITKLLFRLYDVDGGSVTVDGQDVKDITRRSLCNTISLVPQDTVLFNDSLRNNICYAGHKVKEDVLANIIEISELKALVKKLPEGLDTIVGERGLKLSGGERQRVAIARMLARRPKIMVFDEATSALDLETERQIMHCLIDVSKNLTTLIIAHRLSTIRQADNIIVLDGGRIAEQGTHEELLKKNGLYSRLLAKEKFNESKV